MLAFAFATMFFAVLGALPFLPRGKGAAILILGGMALLAFSLCWSMLVLRSARSTLRIQARTRNHPRQTPRPTAAKTPSLVMGIRVPWLGTLLATAVRSGLGEPEIIGVEPNRQVLRLDNCRGCRGRQKSSGCERERADLERVIRSLSPNAEVTETACNLGRKGACNFELRTGANAR